MLLLHEFPGTLNWQVNVLSSKINIEDNQGDMSRDPCYADSRGEGSVYRNTSILRYVGYQIGIF